jgi:hypothetical protein
LLLGQSVEESGIALAVEGDERRQIKQQMAHTEQLPPTSCCCEEEAQYQSAVEPIHVSARNLGL